MKVVILAGGFGTRFAEETEKRPKPLIPIGSRPILWHIMAHYARFGFVQFVIALGCRGELIVSYIRDVLSPGVERPGMPATSESGELETHSASDWEVELVPTGTNTQTGGRLKQLAPYLGNETFMLTYGDGLANINLANLLAFHRAHGKIATVTAVHPPERFGHIELEGARVVRFKEKPTTLDRWINGGFFVLEPQVFDYLDPPNCQWEKEPLERLSSDGELMAFEHDSFWQCMDTRNEQRYLEEIWQSGKAPWISDET